MLATLRALPRHRSLMWFLLGNFCLVDVLNTAVLYFAQFTEDVFAEQAAAGYTLFGEVFQGEAGVGRFMQLAGLGLNVVAMVVGVTIGRWTDRAPLAVMRVSAVALLLGLAGGAAFGGVSPLGYLCTLVALGAFGLTGIWTAGRKVVVQLAPPDQIGQYFGLYGITVKLSVFGALVYGYVDHAFGARPALLAQSTQLLLGLACLFMVRLPQTRDAARP
ncbi:MAG: MFS transporter [Planctomycetota bacterium]